MAKSTTGPYSYHNRPSIEEILNHPHKTSPSSRMLSQQENQKNNDNNNTDNDHDYLQNVDKNNSNSKWLHHKINPSIGDLSRNVRRVQDFQQTNQSTIKTTTQTFPSTSTTTEDPTDDNQKQQEKSSRRKPLNVLLFYADDWTMNVMGALNSHVQTPNIDAMAKRGMLFTRNCVTTSICWISRNTLATGTYSSVHRSNNPGSEYMFNHPRFNWNQTLYPLLKQVGGYYTGLVGKWHAPNPPEHMSQAFDVMKMYYGDHWMERDGRPRHVTDLNGEDALAFLQQWNKRYRYTQQSGKKPIDTTHTKDHRGDTGHRYDYHKDPGHHSERRTISPNKNDNDRMARVRDRLQRLLNHRRLGEERRGNDNKNEKDDFADRGRQQERPFFLKVSFFATHAIDNHDPPYEPMHESMSLYQNVTIPMPKTATHQHYEELPHFMKSKRNEAWKRNQNRFDTFEQYQDKIKNLYRLATEVDAVVGAVIEELKRIEAYDNTMIIFTTDNGNLHGEHGLAEKWYPYEESIRVPLVIQDPRMPKESHGIQNHDDFTLNVDLAPTILSAAGITPPPHMQGRDIAQLYLLDEKEDGQQSPRGLQQLEHQQKAKASWRQDFFYEWNTGDPVDAHDHMFDHEWIPPVFALIRKDYKYFYWPKSNYEQLFHVEQDPYEEKDVFLENSTTTQEVLHIMRARYQFLKEWAQAGNPV